MEQELTTQETQSEMVTNQNQARFAKIFIIGGVIGAIAGLIGAYIFVSNHQDGEDEKMNAATGVQLGLGILGVLRLLTK